MNEPQYLTVIGVASSRCGLARGDDLDELRLDDFIEHQDSFNLCFDHDDEFVLGPALYAERSAIGLMIVGQVRTDMLEPYGPDDGWRMSIGVDGHRVSRTRLAFLRINEVTMCRAGKEAGIGLDPCRFSSHDLTHGGGGAPHGMTLSWHAVWRRAADDLATPSFRRSSGIRLHDVEFEQLVTRSRAANAAKPKPRPKLRTPAVMPALRGEVLPAGVHRRTVGHITAYDGRPV